HTIFSRDWSSDVCSSDLAGIRVAGDAAIVLVPVSKLNQLAKIGKGLRAGTVTMKRGIGLYRAGQAIDILRSEDGTLAEAAGPARSEERRVGERGSRWGCA